MFLLQASSNASEVARLKRERDDLQALLEKFERHLAEVSAPFYHFLHRFRRTFSMVQNLFPKMKV
jgi:hypothetical protein